MNHKPRFDHATHKMLKESREHRFKFYHRLARLGFVAELHVHGPALADNPRRHEWTGVHYLRNDGTFWGDANDGNVKGLEGTGLVQLTSEETTRGVTIWRIESIESCIADVLVKVYPETKEMVELDLYKPSWLFKFEGTWYERVDMGYELESDNPAKYRYIIDLAIPDDYDYVTSGELEEKLDVAWNQVDI